MLLLGTAADRRALGTAPLVQAIKYDNLGQKINKWVWDDAELSPVELVETVWQVLPDFRESYEVAEGLYRRQVPAYDEKVVRELLVNALVHRPYTQRGDVFLNLYPDRLEVVNPGHLPLGVTPRNILHASRRRNDGLLQTLDERYQLSQRERIALGVLAQSEAMTAKDLAASLEVAGTEELGAWTGRLEELGAVQPSGRTSGMKYFVAPGLLLLAVHGCSKRQARTDVLYPAQGCPLGR
ncbi:MAG: ATP-binding protein [Pseudomonadota bacterium]